LGAVKIEVLSTKMKFLKKLVTKWVREDWDNQRAINSGIRASNVIKSASSDDEISTRSSVNFRFHVAQGGTVAQVNWYDSKHDRYESELYIISEDKDLGQEIASIIMQHNLRNG